MKTLSSYVLAVTIATESPQTRFFIGARTWSGKRVCRHQKYLHYRKRFLYLFELTLQQSTIKKEWLKQ